MVSRRDKLKIAVLPGDGIGREVTEAALPVFGALKLPVELCEGDIGWSFWCQEGTPLPRRTWKLIAAADTTLVGAVTSKPKREAYVELCEASKKNNLNYISPIIQLRQTLDLYANVRPCSGLQHDKAFNFCIIRENTEGLYAGFDYHPIPQEVHELLQRHEEWRGVSANDLSVALRLQSKRGLLRLFEFSFSYAKAHGYPRVTLADKPNVLRQSSAFTRQLFEEVAASYPMIKADILNIDAVGLWLVRRPEEFGVIVAENMFGDILSDVGAGVMGGLGLAPSANIGKTASYFEPVHGSAPRLKPNTANPSAMFLTISLLLEHFHYVSEAVKIKQAVGKVIKKGRHITYDLGGSASTTAMANEIIEHCI
jgi:isocitrate/isopropylmalate dehydrogenase